MTALVITRSGTQRLERADLAEGLAEKWLQDLIFRHPEILPLDQVDPGAGVFIPVVRELAIPKPGGNVFLDLLGVTTFGRPVLIECKLWRNPQARREVVAQIIEYAALLRRWSYADLTSRLRPKLAPAPVQSDNPLFDIARRHGTPLSEAVFTDAVASNLRNGDFHLVIAGDGIREDMMAIAEHIGDAGSRLTLVELQRWSDPDGNTVIIPHIPFRTQVVRQRLLLDATGAPAPFADEADDLDAAETARSPHMSAPERQATALANRAFWQSFIDAVRFDHPEQPQPRHGGNNWVRIPLPSPARWITAYRWMGWNGRAGLSLVGEDGSGFIDRLSEQAPEIEAEMAPYPVRWHTPSDPDRIVFSVDEPEGSTDQLGWVIGAANRMVSVLRPRLSEFAVGS